MRMLLVNSLIEGSKQPKLGTDVVDHEMSKLNFMDEKEVQVTAELQANCQKLLTPLDERLKTPPFFSAAFEVFDSIKE